MSSGEPDQVLRRSLLTLLVPPLAGMIAVVVLMLGMYWASLSILVESFSSHYQLLELFLRELRYYAAPVAFALPLGVIIVLLLGVYFLNYFVDPLRKLRKLAGAETGVDGALLRRLRGWLYFQLRNRLLLLVVAGMTLTLLLMGSLYVLSLNYLMNSALFSSDHLVRALDVLSYYGSLTFFALVLSGILIMLVALRKLKSVVGVASETLRNLSAQQLGDKVGLEALDKEMNRVILEFDQAAEEQ